MGMDISQSLLLTDISDARTADSGTYELSNQDQDITEDSLISLSGRVPRNILGNFLSSEDMIVTRSNALLIARRKEDDLRTQLAGKSHTYLYMPSPSHHHYYYHYHYHYHYHPILTFATIFSSLSNSVFVFLPIPSLSFYTTASLNSAHLSLSIIFSSLYHYTRTRMLLTKQNF